MPKPGRNKADRFAGALAVAGAPPLRPEFDQALGDLVLALGEPEFADRFAQACADQCAADQVTAFILDDKGARCVLAHRPSDPDLVESLCQKYTSAYIARDPLLETPAGDGDFETRRLTASEIVDRSYRNRLFRDVGLAGKISAIARWSRRTLYINLYFREAGRARMEAALDNLAARGPVLMSCLQKHDRLIGGALGAQAGRPRAEAYLEKRFPSLSQREIQTCALILCGCTIDGVARALNVSPTTAVTFRKRAYAKLSIGSRGELFDRCVGLNV